MTTGLATSAPLAGNVQNQPEALRQRSEFRKLLPLTKFYSTPNPLPPRAPGTLIHSEEFYEYQLPEGISAIRILYYSRSARGGDVAASGVVLIPEQPPPAHGWPVIAWAHSFIGTARQCAPSLMRNLNEGPFLSMYVKLGYAVVAADYAGLGTDFRNASVDMQSNATDVIYSIAAARAAVPQLGRKWVAIGESAGGQAALAVAELEEEIRDRDYLGSIAISGVADSREFYEQVARTDSMDGLLFLAYGIQTVYPAFQPNQMLTSEGLPVSEQTESSCAANVSGLAPTNRALKPDWENNYYVREFFARNLLGKKPAYGPLLIISSYADPAVRTGMTLRAVKRMCKQGDAVQFHQFQGSDFAAVLGDSVRDQLTWIQERFEGRRASSNCY
ncbi:MAG: lipase family protein [Terriglobales bacterium]